MTLTGSTAVYCRASTDRQDVSGQIRELEAEAERLGLEVTVRYVEKVTATGRVPRAEYDRLMRDLGGPGRPWTHLLVWSLDRFSREEKFTRAVEAVWELERRGVRFHSLREPLLDTPDDGRPNLGREVLLALLPVLASWESRRRSERVRVAAQEVKEGRRKPRSKWGNRWKVTREAIERAVALRSAGKPWSTVAQAVRLPTETIRASVWKSKRGLVTFPSAAVIEDWNAGVRTAP
jgi:DNA invertase Pin-like site-specific DNA recombinase